MGDVLQEKLQTDDYSYMENEKLHQNSETNEDGEPMLMGGSYRTTWVRWIGLTLACMVMIGSYMSYDFPTYLQDDIGQSVFDCDSYGDHTENCKEYKKYYPWLYSVYSFPNVILPLFGGFFIDKIGVRIGLFIFTGFIMLGQLFCALSGLFNGGWSSGWHDSKVFIFLYIGRVIFALGGENQSVTQSTIVSKWFHGKELAFALGTNVSCARLGSVAAGFILPAVYNSSKNLSDTLLVPEVFCIMSFLFMLSLVWMDRAADKQEGVDKNELDPSEAVSLKDITTFPLLYWLITISCLMNYICIFVFLQFGSDFIQNRYGDSTGQAGQMLTLPYLISAGLTPFIGILADKIGKRQYLLLISSSVMLCSHILWLAFPTCTSKDDCDNLSSAGRWAYQIIPLVLMGLFYACYAAIVWPCIPLVLKENVVGTGFGVATAIQNFGLAVAPQAVNAIISNTKKEGGYFWSQIFFISVGILCILLSVLIIIVNARTGDRLGKVSGDTSEAKQSQISRASFKR